MSDKPPPTAPPPPAEPAKAPVIRLVEAARETPQERFIRKHLPAWVISGAVNIGVIALLMLIFGGQDMTAKPTETVVATSVEKEDEPPEQDLTNEDPGLQSNLEAALPELERVDKQTVDAAVTDDNLGQPNAPDTDTTALAVPGLNLSDLSSPGVPGETGDVMAGTGGSGGNVVATFSGRSGATKSKLLREGGGNEASERAVALGLAWLARQQRPDGSWVFDGSYKADNIASTGMALLPFLAAGETHKAGRKYTRTVAAGLNYLIRNCPLSGANAGRMSSNAYAQAIGTLALCEAYGMTKDRSLLLAPAQAAINYIQRAQADNGSWGYSFGNRGDTSIVGWQVQALQAARLGKDIVIDPKVIKKAVEFLNHAGAGSRKSAYGYNDSAGARPGTALTAVGLLCRYYIDGWGPDNPGMAEGVVGLMNRAPGGTTANPRANRPQLDMYFYYYATQVVHFFEGEEWKDWNEGPKGPDGVRRGGMRDWLIELQDKKDGPNQGSWDPRLESHWIGSHCGRLGTTALAVLTLEVYYRHLPLYKRGQNDEALKILEGAR